VRPSDWERVVAARREEGAAATDGAALARRGPEVRSDEVVATSDEVLVRLPGKKRFGELRTARITTATGSRCLCGVGEGFLQTLLLLLLVTVGPSGRLTLVADGARWLTAFFAALQERLPASRLILDWFPLRKKCKDRISRLGGEKAARQALCQQVCRALWRGKVDSALLLLEQYRPQVRQAEATLDELIEYLQRHQAAVPDYGERRRERQYIGSGTAEKANDLLVARRQKRRGMHWNMTTSEGLARLKGLVLNPEWEAYWQQRQLPQLVAP
jgi:hypothetical protein